MYSIPHTTPSRPFKTTLSGCLLAALVLPAAGSRADFDQRIEDALKLGGGQVSFDLRYRYEYVNEEDVSRESANASTLRLRLGYLTPKLYGFQGFAEYEGNQDIFENDYNSLRNSKSRYSAVADPQDNEVNQLWISYDRIPGTLVKGGRQRIAYDNHRFIGNVPWRQLEQTFDGATVVNTSLPHTQIQAGYITNVRTVVSNNDEMDTPIINISYDGFKFGKLTTYAYLIDYNEAAKYRLSTQTYGVRFDGSAPLNDRLTLHYTAEYAWQNDYEKNPVNYEADYLHLVAGASAFGVTGKFGWETLGSQNGVGFSTPLSTLHIHQGWADIFLNTPDDGIRDLYGLIKTTVLGVELLAVYHDFDDDSGKIDYGQELDILATKKFGKHYSVSLKYANFNGDEPGRLRGSKRTFNDTEKWWLFASVNF